MQSLIDRIKGWSWKVYAGAALAGVLATLKQMHPDWQWIDYVLAMLAGLGFTIDPKKGVKS